ncbi:MAG: DUF4347 domain-containing protein [Myxacorys chilensis ATA2-1-KO14]|jgi:hypothetical protein|nr:DUF4347 domain-containing protein [Myxacorys chilensis ATA2-1-KO14]
MNFERSSTTGLTSTPNTSSDRISRPLLHLPSTPQSAASGTTSLLFIDTGVNDYQSLLAGVQPNTEVRVLDSNQDAIAQITQTLMGRSNISSLHIVSHAEAGSLQLGSDWVDLQDLDRDSTQIRSWASALTEDADILLYGCNVAAGKIGQTFVQQLAKLTSADVAASTDITGNAALGGNWSLEATTGEIEAPLAFQAAVLNSYLGILPSSSVVISQVYGAGGNSGATYKNDFIELFNRGTTAVDLTGWTVQYAASMGTAWSSTVLSGSISPGSYYLISQISEGANGSALPSPDASGSLAMSSTTGKVALVNNTTSLIGANPTGASVVDLVGYGAANGSEGSPTGALSNTTAAIRKSGNIDTDNNLNDFTVNTPRPRNAKSTPAIGLSATPLSYSENAGSIAINSTLTLTDADSPNFNGGTLTVDFTSGANSNDILLIRNDPAGAGQVSAGVDSPGRNSLRVGVQTIGAFTGGTNGTPLVITFNANATPTNVQALMRNITYSNLSDAPVAGDRTVRFRLIDDTGAIGTASKTVSLTAVNDAPVIAAPGASITLFNGTNNTPNSQGFVYQTLPNLPLAAVQSGNTLNTSGLIQDYVGYIAKPELMPNLDRTTGYSLKFAVQVNAENHSDPGAEKNGDGNADRAGFSVTVLGNDKKGIELGFWENRIWAQNDGTAEPPTGTLFTQGEGANLDTKTKSVNYEIRVLDNTYRLFADGTQILTGTLRDYSSFVAPAFLPSNPYQTPNFLFLGDNTPTSSANFTLGAVSVTTGSTTSLTAQQDTDFVVPGISLNDVDAGNNIITATLQAFAGSLKVNSNVSGGVTSVSGNGTSSVVLSGTISQINTTLSNVTGLIYRGNSGFVGNDSIDVTVNDGGFSGAGGSKTALKTIVLNVQALPTLSINNVSQVEGNSGTKTYAFTVNLSQASQETVTVNYGTIDGSAKISNNDYLAASDILTFNAGEVSKTIEIQVNGDTNFELDETFLVKLSNASNARIIAGADTGIGTVVDDDKSGWTIAETADFDKDGKVDVLWRNISTGGTAIWKMNGTTFETSIPLAVADPNWRIESVADFDKNGYLDLLWRNTSTGTTAIWTMNGFTVTGSVALPAAPIDWSIEGVADFDRDGFVDILWHNTNTGGNAIWKMNGTSVATSIALSATTLSWQIKGIADFDNDGFVDILWHNNATGGNAFWKMNGMSVSTSVALSATPAEWQIAGVADFDNDGFTDILWRNSSTGGTAIWKMNGTSAPTSTALSFADLDWQVEDLSDLDGDGFVDIVWRNYSTGGNALWKMNGTTVTTSIALRAA